MNAEEISFSISGNRHTISKNEHGVWVTNRDVISDDTIESLQHLSNEDHDEIFKISSKARLEALLWAVNNGIIYDVDDFRSINRSISRQSNKSFIAKPTFVPYLAVCLHLLSSYPQVHDFMPSADNCVPSTTHSNRTRVNFAPEEFRWVDQNFNHGDWSMNPEPYIAIFELCEKLLNQYIKEGIDETKQRAVLLQAHIWYELLSIKPIELQLQVLPRFLSLLDVVSLIKYDMTRTEDMEHIIHLEKGDSFPIIRNQSWYLRRDPVYDYFTYIIHRIYSRKLQRWTQHSLTVLLLMSHTDPSRPSYWRILVALGELARIRYLSYPYIMNDLTKLRDAADVGSATRIENLMESLRFDATDELREHADQVIATPDTSTLEPMQTQ